MSGVYDGMNLVELLDALEPVPAPEPVSMWPQTAGWLWLGLAVLVGCVWLVRVLVRRHRANAYRRAALAALEAAQDRPAQIAEVLRRTALAAYPRAKVAGLTGAPWLAFLDASFPGEGFEEGPGQVLITAPYRDEPENPSLAALARDWVRHHRREPV